MKMKNNYINFRNFKTISYTVISKNYLTIFLKKKKKKKFYYPEDWTGSVKMVGPERYHYATEDWSSGANLYNLYSLLCVVSLQHCFDYFFMKIFLYITSISYSHLLLFDLVIYDVIISGNTWKKTPFTKNSTNRKRSNRRSEITNSDDISRCLAIILQF